MDGDPARWRSLGGHPRAFFRSSRFFFLHPSARGWGDGEDGGPIGNLANVFAPLAAVGIAALGGAAVVFSEYDDAPGGILVGLLLIVGAGAFAVWAAQRGGR